MTGASSMAMDPGSSGLSSACMRSSANAPPTCRPIASAAAPAQRTTRVLGLSVRCAVEVTRSTTLRSVDGLEADPLLPTSEVAARGLQISATTRVARGRGRARNTTRERTQLVALPLW